MPPFPIKALPLRLFPARRRWALAHDMDSAVTAVKSPTLPQLSCSSLPAQRAKNERRARRRRPRVVHTPRLSHSSATVSDPYASLMMIQENLPLRYAACDWELVYSTMRDGTSLGTLYHKVGEEPVVLLVRDAGGAVFGCFSSVGWKTGKQYFGNGEGFVFTLKPNVNVFRWSRKNAWFQLGGAHSLAVGGGGKFALFVDEMLERGSSGMCETYDSPCLASAEEFDIVVVEAFRMVPRLRGIDSNKEL